MLRDTRPVQITIVDGQGLPVANANVGAVFRFRGVVEYYDILAAAQQTSFQLTDTVGGAILRTPADLPLGSDFAVKPGTAGSPRMAASVAVRVRYYICLMNCVMT